MGKHKEAEGGHENSEKAAKAEEVSKKAESKEELQEGQKKEQKEVHRGKERKKPRERRKVKVKKKHVYVGGGAVVVIGLLLIAGFMINQAVTERPGGEIPETGIRNGYAVQVDYVGKLGDGSVFDTSYEKIARQEGLYQELRSYEPLEVTVGRGEVIQGFDEALVGMEVGGRKTVTIPPAEAYGEYDPRKVSALERIQLVERVTEVDRFVAVTKEVFLEAFSKEPVMGEEVEYAPFKFRVGAVEELIHLENIAEEGDILRLPNSNWDSTVTEVGGERIKIRQDPKEGQVIAVELGDATVGLTETDIVLTIDAVIGKSIYTPAGIVRVIGQNDTHISLDGNHELAGKTLIFEIEVVSAEAPELSGKPALMLFVMSFCPYGQMAEDFTYPVQKLFGDKADFDLRFVIYGPEVYSGRESQYCVQDVCAMHGIPELEENMRQACIKKYEPDKLWDYLMCVKNTCSLGTIGTCWNGCALQGGIDVQATEACVEAEGVGLMQKDKALNAQYGVSGSPSIFINDDPYQGQRTPESMKEELCKYFGEVPAECFEALDASATSADGTC